MNVVIERRGLVRRRPGTAQRLRLCLASDRSLPFVALLPRKKVSDGESSDGKSTPLNSEIASCLHSPNKALEPTPPSVTDRANARSAPAGVVAHL